MSVQIELAPLYRALETAKDGARRAYEANKAAGQPEAFDAGRYEGLKQALEIVEAQVRHSGA